MNKDDIMHLANATSGQDWMDEAHIQRFADALIKAEREACARVCETIYEYDQDVDTYYSDIYATAIRARGEE